MSAGKAFVQKLAPFFKSQAYFKGFQNVSLDQFKGNYLVLFFYPLDFTFVCPTEIIKFSEKAKAFRQIKCEVLGCSVDSIYTHMEYVKKPRKDGGLGELDIPLMSDLDKKISSDYGVLLDGGVSLRGTFIIDGKSILRHIGMNDLPVGRNVDEVYRLVQGYQYADSHGEVCPASWKPGDATMVPNHDDKKTQNYWQNVHAKN